MTVYTFLPVELRPTAEVALEYFSTANGISSSKFEIESPINAQVAYKPTFHVITRDQKIICVDVVKSYTGVLESFILDCVTAGLPVEMHIAVPTDAGALLRDAARAAKVGVGILEVAAIPTVVRPAIALSLASVRRPHLKDFPPSYRSALSHAIDTFLVADPPKGTLLVHEEIEAVTRKIALKIDKQKAWRSLPSGQTSPALKFETSPWQNVTETLIKHADLQKIGCPELTLPLLGRVLGLPDLRNANAHKPKSVNARVKRDSEMRTRFESACDTLRDLIVAAKPLKI